MQQSVKLEIVEVNYDFLVSIGKSQKLDMKLVVLIAESNQSAHRKRDVTQFV